MLVCECGEGVGKVQIFCNDVQTCLAGREERGVNGGMRKWVRRWPKREDILRNGFREEIG